MMTKEDILREIKRTAKENGGKPLGQKNFLNETGIRSWDWGKYWPRYGDALIDAGFEPNKKWTKYPDNLLAEKMIPLMRILKKYPTIGEMRIEHLKNPEFPFHIADKKLKNDVVRIIASYCEDKSEYSDIMAICEPLLMDKDLDESSSSSSAPIGEVYLLKHDSDYKIGKTNDSIRRGKEIKLLLPNDLMLIHIIKTDDPGGVEAYWHQRFKHKNTNGEWFKLNRQDVLAFKKWKRIS
ncbi:MAG: GIY-YIG nuclease family protein [Candidatus Saccharibacteria bacterium]|nr:GIY-YIG nuclease family protein [Candidatus Saccharibacteria bacterium]